MLVDQIDREVIDAQTAAVSSHIITRILLRIILALTLLVRPKIVNAPSTLTKPPTIAIAKNDDSDCELDAKLGGPKEPHAFICIHSHSTSTLLLHLQQSVRSSKRKTNNKHQVR